MKIKQLLAEKKSAYVECIGPNTTLRETAEKLIKFRIGALVVVDKAGAMLGIVSERDLIQVVADRSVTAADELVTHVMTRSVITCEPDDEISYILRLMNLNAIRHMPVIEHGKLVNMVSIRELTTAYELLQIEANTDPLTELSNRRPFFKTLESEFARARRFKHSLSVAMIDIDYFKKVNDTYGHDAGDRVLRAISAMLISEFRTIEQVGRLGGEEFGVVFPEKNLAEAKSACEHLMSAIQGAIIPVNGNQISITVSIGLAEASTNIIEWSGILKRADELLYDAKANGRNRIVVEGEHGQKLALGGR